MSKVWAVSTNKGGVLKTTSTVNLAGVLAKNKRVLIVDADNQGNVALSFGHNPDSLTNTLYDVLVNGMEPQQAIMNVYKNIDVLPSNDDMAFFEFDVFRNPAKYPDPYTLLRDRLQDVRDQYDCIIIDTPPNLGLATGNVLTLADEVLIPFQPESYSMRSLIKIIKAINEFKASYNPALSIMGVVATLVDSRTNLHSVVLQECRKFCAQEGIRLFETTIPRSVRFANSTAFDSLPATIADSKDKVVQNYFQLAKEMIG